MKPRSTSLQEPLRWQAVEKVTAAGRTQSITLRLFDGNGVEPPKPLRYLPAAEPFYLGTDTVFRGPPSFDDGTTAQTSIEIPVEALSTEEGIRFLEKTGRSACRPASPPGSPGRRFQVQLSARCLPKVEQGGTEHVAITAQAVSSNGLLTKTLRGRRWEVTEQVRASDGVIPATIAPLSTAVPTGSGGRQGHLRPELSAFTPASPGFPRAVPRLGQEPPRHHETGDGRPPSLHSRRSPQGHGPPGD